MSYKKNITANYIGQAYVIIINMASLPIIVKIMGAEAYGLVGFFTVVQSWFMLLDFGITPTICRQTANCLKEPEKLYRLKQLIRLIEILSFLISIFGIAFFFYFSDFISSKWLQVKQLSIEEVKYCLFLMTILVSFRWLTGLYKGVVTGLEQLIWLNKINSITSTFKFIVIIPFLGYYDSTPSTFFKYQLIVGVIETLVYFYKVNGYLPKTNSLFPIIKEISIKEILNFSLVISFTNIVWILITQTDKLILSNILNLADYTYFTLAVQLAYAPLLICSPMTNALLPRLATIAARNDFKELSVKYRQGIQLVSIIATPISLIIILYPKQLLHLWCNNELITSNAFFTLYLYAIGNWFMVLASFPYYLQFALGNLKLHFIGNCLFLLIYIPELLWATKNFGVIGAGYSWLFSNLIFFFIWVPIVHRLLLKTYSTKSFFLDVFKPIILTLLMGFLSRIMFDTFIVDLTSRLYCLIYLLIVGSTLVIVSILMSPFLKNNMYNYFKSKPFCSPDEKKI